MTVPVPKVSSHERATALLEVVLALALFVAAAAIITSGINASTENLQRQRLNTHALELAASVLAEVQLGIRSIAASGEQPFEAPFEEWTWQISAAPLESETGEAAGSLKVEVVIRHKQSPVVRRLAQWIRVDSLTRPAAVVESPREASL